jgi:hypothetical protein
MEGTTAQSFFDQTVIIVSGVDYNWDAIKIVVYNGTEVVGQSDFLMPIFAANPNVYAKDHPGVLNGLHPFWSQRSTTGMTDQAWANRAGSYCF